MLQIVTDKYRKAVSLLKSDTAFLLSMKNVKFQMKNSFL